MSEQAIYQSMEKELKRNLVARLDRNGDDIDMDDIIIESAYTIAVNVLISERQLENQTNGQIKKMPADTLKLMFNILKKILNSISQDFESFHFEKIEEKYNEIVTSNNPKKIINNHYNELYGSFGGNVI